MRQYLLLTIVACAFIACSTPQTKVESSHVFNMDSVKTFLNAHNERFSSEMINGDSAAIAKDYLSDASVLPPDMPAGKGGAVIGGVSTMMKNMHATQFKVWMTDVQGNEEMIVEEGRWELRGENNMKDAGKFVVLWKPVNGEWKIAKDIWNRDAPLPTK
jgi:ketosteroid isomerase-like protein